MNALDGWVCYIVTFNPHHSFLFVLISHLKLLDDLCNILWSDVGHLHRRKTKLAEEPEDLTVLFTDMCSNLTVLLAEQPCWESTCKVLRVGQKTCIKLKEKPPKNVRQIIEKGAAETAISGSGRLS